MKLLWLLLLAVTLLHFVPDSNQEEHGLRLPELAVSEDDEGETIASFDSQRNESPFGTEEEEPARRVRGRNMKRRRRLRKRIRTTTEPPLEELNKQLNAAEQQNSAEQQSAVKQQTPVEQQAPVEQPSTVEQDVGYEQPRTLEEGATALPPLEETTRRRPGKRRRRPHRKQLSSTQQDGTSERPEDGSSETPKPSRRRRKGGRRRPRPTVKPTEPNKIELHIETTVFPPEAPEISTPAYLLESITQPPPPFTESPDHTLTVLKDDNTTLYSIYDSRHNLVSQPSVNLVVDGNGQHFSQPSRIPDTLLFPEASEVSHQSIIQQDSKFPEPTKYMETRFSHGSRIPNFSEEQPSKFPESSRFKDIAKSTVTLEYPEPNRFTEQQFPLPSRLPDVRQQSETSFNRSPNPSPVYEEPVQYSQISKFPDTPKKTEPHKYLEYEQNKPSKLPGDTAHGYSPSNIARPKPYSSRPTANIIKPVQELIQETEPEPSEHHEERIDKETNEVPSQPPIEAISSQPAFDRKVLFAKSRKLPETSAIIRKKLIPRYQRGQQETGKSSKTESPEKMVPEGYNVPPVTVEPSKLIENLKAHSKAYRTTTVMIPSTIMTTEEPNYPKFESKKKNSVTETTGKTTTESVRFNTVVELHRSRGKIVITTTEAPQFESPQTTDLEQTGETETTEPGQVIVDKLPDVQTTALPEKSDPQKLDLNQLNDSIVELLRSESGNMKLSEILESRNMTIAQLLEHRERGSKHFHLVDIFSKRKAIIGENTTDSMNADKAEVGTPISLDQQTIPFPSQDILGSFPSFISDKVESGVQTKDGMNESTTRRSVHLENRVPRVFQSMPEFKKTDDQPPWKVLNPKLRPVNIRGDIEEIKISQYPPETPKSENDIDHAFLLDDKSDLLRTNRGVTTLESESHSQETAFGRFKRIPVTVKSAIIISIAILMLAIFGFLSVLISCRLRQKKARLRVKQEILCEHLKNEDFMNSQQSLSSVLTKQQGRAPPVFTQNTIPSSTANNRQYYLWRTLRKTFQYD